MHCNHQPAAAVAEISPTESKCMHFQGLQNGKFGHSVDIAQPIDGHTYLYVISAIEISRLSGLSISFLPNSVTRQLFLGGQHTTVPCNTFFCRSHLISPSHANCEEMRVRRGQNSEKCEERGGEGDAVS